MRAIFHINSMWKVQHNHLGFHIRHMNRLSLSKVDGFLHYAISHQVDIDPIVLGFILVSLLHFNLVYSTQLQTNFPIGLSSSNNNKHNMKACKLYEMPVTCQNLSKTYYDPLIMRVTRLLIKSQLYTCNDIFQHVYFRIQFSILVHECQNSPTNDDVSSKHDVISRMDHATYEFILALVHIIELLC